MSVSDVLERIAEIRAGLVPPALATPPVAAPADTANAFSTLLRSAGATAPRRR